MKTNPSLTIIVTLLIGVTLGAMGTRFFTSMSAYANVSAHISQGRSIMQQIAAYQDANGSAPDHQWFASLGKMTKTSEGFQWIYLNPPLLMDEGRKVVILTATKYNSLYLCGFSDSVLGFSELKRTSKANKS